MRKISEITIVFVGIATMAFFSMARPALAEGEPSLEQEKIIVHLFDDRLCPVCHKTKAFIQDLGEDYPQIEVNLYSITDLEKFHQIAKEHAVEDYTVMAPTVFIGDNFFQFRDFTSREEEMIIKALEGGIVEQEECCVIKIPILNTEIDIGNWPLPIITIILGSLDGFNICSAGALILVISIVMVFDSKRKMFFYGSLFIITAAVVYGSLVFIWGGVAELLLGHLEIMRTMVGLAALFGGIYFAKEFRRFLKYGPTCQFSDSVLVKKATDKLRKTFEGPDKGTLLLAGTIMFFAAVVTLVELPCSIGLPIAFTGILLEAGITPAAALFSYSLYILIYLFFFMLIELIIFTGAVLTKKIWFASHKMITWVTFIGSAVLFYLAFYYLFS